MRKKLLALLMCATMVLGTAVTSSAATLVEADYKAADTIIGQYKYFAGEFNNGKFGEYTKEQITFMTNYEAVGGTTAQYKYAFTEPDDDKDATNYVKVNKDGKPFVEVGNAAEISASVDSTTVANVRQIIVNESIKAKTLVKAFDGGKDHYYYVSEAIANKANEDVKGKTIAVVRTPITGTTTIATAGAAQVLTIEEYTPTDKTSISEYVPTGADPLQDAFGKDVDGYIPLTRDKNTTWSLYSTVSKGYYVDVTEATADKVDIANAFHDGLISKDAVAVHLDFYKLDTAAVPVLSYAGKVANQSVMQQVRYCAASREETPVTLTTDWLSRTNLKSASGVAAFILDEFVPSTANTFTRVGSLVKVADIADGKFTADYVISGTYIFDVAAATDNAGQADADKGTTDTAKQMGDTAPIAALAVVMLGAFGAMVVASKKRA